MDAPRAQASTVLSTRKKLLFSLLSVLLFFVGAELVLTVAGVEPTRSHEDPFVGFVGSDPLFVPDQDAQGEPILVTAPNKRGFFNPQAFPAAKQPGTLRVFCLGGSTTYGRPYSDRTSFAGWLRVLLPEADPGRRVEVINAGGISYASYRVARVAEEVLAYDPDVLVVYTGHNEFLEERTYGEVRERSVLLNGAIDVVSRTRIGAVVAQALGVSQEAVDGRTVLPSEVEAELDHSAGLDLYTRDDALAEGVETHFRTTLERLADRCAEAGVELVLVTPASHLADFSPFKSEPSDGLTAEQRRTVDEEVRAVETALASGDTGAARRAAERAVDVDPRDARAQWWRGRALEAAGEVEAAEQAYVRARDEDVCTLRATSDLQRIVREVARERGIPQVDFVERLREASLQRTGEPAVGEEFFLDHVHPTIEGHRLLALDLLALFAERGWIDRSPDFGPAVVARVSERVEASVSKEDHARALANLALVLSWAGKGEDSRRLAERALETGVEDPTIFLMAGRHAALEGRNDEARRYYRRAVAANPNNAIARSQAGFFLAGIGEREAAAAQFWIGSLMAGSDPNFFRQLGFVLQQLGRFDVALAAFESALRLAPQDASLRERVDALTARVPADERLESLVPEVTRHDSGYPRTMTTTRAVDAGSREAHGIRVEWHSTGELARYVELEHGVEHGREVRWDREGREVERRRLVHGEPVAAPDGR